MQPIIASLMAFPQAGGVVPRASAGQAGDPGVDFVTLLTEGLVDVAAVLADDQGTSDAAPEAEGETPTPETGVEAKDILPDDDGTLGLPLQVSGAPADPVVPGPKAEPSTFELRTRTTSVTEHAPQSPTMLAKPGAEPVLSRSEYAAPDTAQPAGEADGFMARGVETPEPQDIPQTGVAMPKGLATAAEAKFAQALSFEGAQTVAVTKLADGQSHLMQKALSDIGTPEAEKPARDAIPPHVNHVVKVPVADAPGAQPLAAARLFQPPAQSVAQRNAAVPLTPWVSTGAADNEIRAVPRQSQSGARTVPDIPADIGRVAPANRSSNIDAVAHVADRAGEGDAAFDGPAPVVAAQPFPRPARGAAPDAVPLANATAESVRASNVSTLAAMDTFAAARPSAERAEVGAINGQASLGLAAEVSFPSVKGRTGATELAMESGLTIAAGQADTGWRGTPNGLATPRTLGPLHVHETTVHRQLAEAVPQQADQPIEIVLKPVELGRVKMVMQMSDGVPVLQVSAERPETLDLIRRNVESLVNEFRAQGFSGLNVAFGGEGQAGFSAWQDARSDQSGPTNREHGAPSEPEHMTPVTSRASASLPADRLDIRM